MNNATIREIARALGLQLIEHNYIANRNEAVRRALCNSGTHYFDADTMRAFGSSVNRIIWTDHGLFVSVVERHSIDPDHRSKGYRAVLIDCTGSVIHKGQAYKTAGPAAREALVMTNGADLDAIVRRMIDDKNAAGVRAIDAARKAANIARGAN